MAEKFKKNLVVVSVMLAFFAVLMIFFPAISWNLEDLSLVEADFGLSGIQTAFGWEMDIEEESYEVFEFSFCGCMTYCLPFLSIILISAADKNQNEKFYYGAIGCLVLAAILFFLSPELLQYAEQEAKEEVEDYMTLGAGAIIGGITCIVAALCLKVHINEMGEESKKESVVQEG